MVQTASVGTVVAAGVEPRHWFDEDCRKVFSTCAEHFQTWQKPPSEAAVKRIHPDFKIMPVTDDLGYLIEEFRVECAYKNGVTKWRDIGTELDKVESGDREARSRIVETFMEHAREMAVLVPTPRSSRLSDMAQRVATIKRQQEDGALPGVRIGIPQLDPYVHVVRPTEFVVHCGYSGRGKSSGLVRSAIAAYQEGENGIFFSLEMEADEIWEIFDAHVSQLSRTAIRRRELGQDDYRVYSAAAERVRNAKNDIIVYDDADGAPTIDKLAALVEKHRPGFVCVDYISLMASTLKSHADWERVTLISRSLKQLARNAKIKLYAAAQNNRDAADNGPTEDNIAFSSSIFQDCNVMVGYHTDPVMERMKKMEVRLIKNRGGSKGPIGPSGYGTIFEFWDRDRMQFETWERRHEWAVKLEQSDV